LPQVEIDIRLRPHQLTLWESAKRFNVWVLHRRAGKSYVCAIKLLAGMVECARPNARFAYIAPTYIMAKAIAWVYFKEFLGDVPGIEFNEAELRVIYPNGAEIQLLGGEQYDRLRGRYLDGCVLDEAAFIPSSALDQVLYPALADRLGWLVVTGTPNGRQNLLHECWQVAGMDPEEWDRRLYTVEDTDALDPKEVARLKRSMSRAAFQQEMMCAWDAATPGAYYQKEMEAIGPRVTSIKYDKAYPVTAALDLGWSDALVTTHWQQVGTEHRCLLATAHTQTVISDLVREWRSLEWPIQLVVLPHDARVKDMGSGLTRQEIFHHLGCVTTIAPNQSVHEGIEQVRDLLPHTWMDEENTRTLREALIAYRSDYDEVKRVHSTKPVHDWASHWADSVRYYAIGRENAMLRSNNAELRRRLARGVI